jgi:hypothetical protein
MRARQHAEARARIDFFVGGGWIVMSVEMTTCHLEQIGDYGRKIAFACGESDSTEMLLIRELCLAIDDEVALAISSLGDAAQETEPWCGVSRPTPYLQLVPGAVRRMTA